MKACYPGADVDRLTKHIWRMYDTNNDGAIDFRQRSDVLKKSYPSFKNFLRANCLIHSYFINSAELICTFHKILSSGVGS